MATQWPLQKDCNKFYGNPSNPKDKSRASAAWESANLVNIKPPYKMYYGTSVQKTIRVHKKCAESLLRVLNAIWVASGKNQKVVDEWGASKYAGCYNYRLMRGGSSLSMHSYGCAIDLDPANNGLRDSTPRFAHYPEVVKAFHDEGWEWGGPWSNYDGMHWQAAWTKPSAVSKFPDLARLGGKKKSAAVGFMPPSNDDGPALPTPVTPTVPEFIWAIDPTDKDQVKPIQEKLSAKGWSDLGLIDGVIGKRTEGMILAFRNENGLPASTVIDTEFLDTLESSGSRVVSPERAAATTSTLVKAGEPVTVENNRIEKVGLGAGVFAGIGGIDQQGWLDNMKSQIDNIDSAKSIWDKALGLMQWAAQKWWIPILLIAGFIAYRAYKAKKIRAAEFRTGQTAMIESLPEPTPTVASRVKSFFKG